VLPGNEDISAIVLSGGKSSRMGSDKGLEELNGIPLIKYAINALEELTDAIIISSNSEEYLRFGKPLVKDIHSHIGPMDWIREGLRYSTSDLNLVLSCDMPFVTRHLFDLLISEMGNSPVAVPWYRDDHFEPMAAVYHKDILAYLEEYISGGNFKLPDLFRKIPVKKIKLPLDDEFYHPYYFFNVNTENDLKKAGNILNESGNKDPEAE
jgi:molybdopterin-guanine dinucleotide biosynthesis protein A